MCVRPDLRLAGPNVFLGETFLFEVHDESAECRLLLAAHEVGREVERRLGDQRVQNVLTNRLTLLRSVSALQNLANRLPKLLATIKADRLQKCRVDLGEAKLLQILHEECDADHLASERRVRRA